jgi:hypothetical protein
VLSECLFRAFAYDVTGSVDITDFIAALAVLNGKDRTLTLQFVFRVYDLNGSSVIERSKVERLLQMAYGDRLKEKTGADVSRAQQQLDSIFSLKKETANTPRLPPLPPLKGKNEVSRVVSSTLNLRDFELYHGPLDVLGGWVLAVLSVFTEPLPRKLLALHNRYTISSKQLDIMGKYDINKSTTDQLRETFLNRCATTGAKPELTLQSWMEWTAGFLAPKLANLIFSMKTSVVKTVWFFEDFVEFCIVFGSGSTEQKATAVTYAVFCAHHKEQRDYLYSLQKSLSVYEENCEEKFFKLLRKVRRHDKEEGRGGRGGDENGRGLGNNMKTSPAKNGKSYDHYNARSSTSSSSSSSSSSNSSSSSSSNTSDVDDSECAVERKRLFKHLTALVQLTLRHPQDELLPPPLLRSASLTAASASLSQHPSSSNRSKDIGSYNDVSGDEKDRGPKLQLALPLHSRSVSLPFKKDHLINGVLGNMRIEEERKKTKNENVTAAVMSAVEELERSCAAESTDSRYSPTGRALHGFIDLIAETHAQNFPGLNDLTVCACCLFGVKPSLSSKEKELIMELMLRRQKASPQSKESPLGAIGTEWCVINKEWWDGWCKYAGGQGGAVRSPGGSPTSSPRLSQHSQPAMVDNWAIVTKQGGIMQIAQGLTVGRQVRFTALHCISFIFNYKQFSLHFYPYLYLYPYSHPLSISISSLVFTSTSIPVSTLPLSYNLILPSPLFLPLDWLPCSSYV